MWCSSRSRLEPLGAGVPSASDSDRPAAFVRKADRGGCDPGAPYRSIEFKLVEPHRGEQSSDRSANDPAPPEFHKAQFDVAGGIDPAREVRFDLINSRTVGEHVRNASRAWAKMRNLLAPGGVATAFDPTLHAPPFIIN
jgi:SAM-dependent methyltransferase